MQGAALVPPFRRRVALFTVALDNFGPAKSIVSLALRMNRRWFDVMVCTCVAGGSPQRLEALEAASIPVFTLGMAGPFDLRGLWRLVRLLRRERIDVLHARVQRAAFYGRLAGRFAGVPMTIVNVVNMYSSHFICQHGWLLGRLLLAVDRLTLPLADVVVANSAAAAQDFVVRTGWEAGRVVTIHNGIDMAAFVPTERVRGRVRTSLGYGDEDFVVGNVSRLVPLKNIECLIDAVHVIAQRQPRVRLLLVGDGTDRGRLEARAAPLRDRVRFLGEREDVPELLQSMDLFAFPSTSEGQPNAVLEAMAAGLPVVAGDIAGMRELVRHGETGLLVESDAEALAAGIESLVVDREAAARLGAGGRDRVRRLFDVEEKVRQFERLYATEPRRAAHIVGVR